MAYRFAGSSDFVEFAAAPLVGSLDPVTVAIFWLRNPVGGGDTAVSFNSSTLTTRGDFRVASDNKPYWFDGSNFPNGPQVMGSNTTYYLLVFTKPAGSAVASRFHVHDGTSWNHAAGTATVAPITLVSGDKLRVGISDTTFNPFVGDIVCVGIKKADSADLAVETLSRTAFSAWRAFGFDWLIGFDSSLVTAGVLQDQATAGTGDETTRSGTSLVSDPAGWAWTSVVAPVADFTGTPLTGTGSLAVAFTDTSTNTPTSWAWTFGDGGTSTSQNPTHSYTSPGVYTVVLVATNAAGSNTKTRTGYVTVIAGFVPKITWIN
jgi:PKD domain